MKQFTDRRVVSHNLRQLGLCALRLQHRQEDETDRKKQAALGHFLSELAEVVDYEVHCLMMDKEKTFESLGLPLVQYKDAVAILEQLGFEKAEGKYIAPTLVKTGRLNKISEYLMPTESRPEKGREISYFSTFSRKSAWT